MSECNKELLVAEAKRILSNYGMTENNGYNIYPVDANDEFVIHVARPFLPYGRRKQAVETKKREIKKFKEAAKAFKDKTGYIIRRIW